MKSTLAFTIVVACVAAACSSPVIQAPNYAAVGRKIQGIRNLVSAGICQVETIAKDDNAAVGSSIESQLEAAASEARAVFAIAQAGVDGQNLTVTEAEALFGQLKDILAGLQADLQDELADLSATAANEIRDIFYSSYASVEVTAQEIYELLAAKSAIHAPDYATVGAKVEEVRDFVREVIEKIKAIANNDNAAVGSDISSQLDAAAVKATAVLERAKVAIEAQSLTVAQAQALFTELKDILVGVQTDLQDELAQLSTGAAGQIRDLFYGAYAKAEALAQEIYALLSA